MTSKPKAILALCSITGNIVEPWIGNGYHAILVDPQHGVDSVDGLTTKHACTVREFIDNGHLEASLGRFEVIFVAAFPPCTDLAVSGARWFKRKAEANPAFQEEAMAVVMECVKVAEACKCPYFIENPVSVISSKWRRPDYTFHPFHYTLFEPADTYTKKTCLWTGGGFELPMRAEMDNAPEPDNRIHMAPPSKERCNIRSATPMGFAWAIHFYYAL